MRWRACTAVAVLAVLTMLGYLGLSIYNSRQATQRVETRLRTPANPLQIGAAISGLELDVAQRLLGEHSTSQPEQSVLRASLALYRGDCDEARARLASVGSSSIESVRELSTVAEGCSRAMAASRIVNDQAGGIWVRLQNDDDATWVPLIVDVAAQARAAASRQLGVSANLPLRIELVMDHQSLSTLTGLPVQAAETTGTVAVARWGRVVMLSPRAFAKGYPWQDTLAHEITHLMVTRASRDCAPLWLQEALAKHLETTWRPARPLDNQPNQHEIVRTAWLQGRSVGIDRLGPSIALLPDPAAAGIAYAEVYDFLDFILGRASWDAIRLLLRDMRVVGHDNTDVALRSVTGYSLAEWMRLWQGALAQESPARSNLGRSRDEMDRHTEQLARRFRLSELFAERGHYGAVLQMLPMAELETLGVPEVRSIVGLANLQVTSPETALKALGDEHQLMLLQGEWLSLRGRAFSELGNLQQAANYFDWALAYAPTDERVACEGYRPSRGDLKGRDPLPIAATRLGLCFAARSAAVSAREP